MKNSIISIIACVIAIIALGVALLPNDMIEENPQGLQFYRLDDGTYIVSCGDSKYLSNIVIPGTYKGGAVVGLDNKAFEDCDSLTSITIPDSVTSIGNHTFWGCNNLASVVISDSITSIGIYTFDSCTSLTSIVIPNAVTSIGGSAFSGCTSLASIRFEGTVEQWEAITFGSGWNWKVPATEVICSDGVVSLK